LTNVRIAAAGVDQPICRIGIKDSMLMTLA
jgi:hypothetical protein